MEAFKLFDWLSSAAIDAGRVLGLKGAASNAVYQPTVVVFTSSDKQFRTAVDMWEECLEGKTYEEVRDILVTRMQRIPTPSVNEL